MRRWMIIGLVALVLAGCTNESKIESVDNEGVTAPTNEQNLPSASGEAVGMPVPDASSSGEPEQQADVLSEAKLGQEASFGYADETGRLLILEPDAAAAASNPDMITVAVGEGGERLTIKHVGTQQGDDQDNGRQTSYNFTHRAGALYEVIDGHAVPNETYLLLDGKSLPQAALLKVEFITDQAVEEQRVQQLAAAKSRKVKQAWRLATIAENQTLYLIQFEREQDSMLASLALEDNGQWVFMDYPATYNESGTWRVDDGGQVVPDMFSVLLAARTAEGMVLGMKWLGAEGENVLFLSQRPGQLIQLDLSYGRYTSPL